jgi:hypothetical protein
MSTIAPARITQIIWKLNNYYADIGHTVEACSGVGHGTRDLVVHKPGCGCDIWQGLIRALPEYDEEATDKAGTGRKDRFVLADGTVISYDAQRGFWREGVPQPEEPEMSTTTIAGITYDPIGASMLPAGGKIIWVTPRRCQGQIVEVSYSLGIPAGKNINYEADLGDPYMRVIDNSDGHVAYYVRRGSRAGGD